MSHSPMDHDFLSVAFEIEARRKLGFGSRKYAEDYHENCEGKNGMYVQGRRVEGTTKRTTPK